MIPQRLIMGDALAATLGFPAPQAGIAVVDRQGQVWTWNSGHDGLSGLDGFWQSLIGKGGQIGGMIAKGAIAGPVGALVGAGIGIVTSIIAAIFGAHSAKVKRENEISTAWAQQGPAAIAAIMQAWEGGQVSGADAKAGLQQILAQAHEMFTPITKYQGKLGAFPDPNSSRPPNNCNWGCGTWWDLNQQVKQLNSQIDSKPGIADAFTGADPVILIGLAVAGYFLLK